MSLKNRQQCILLLIGLCLCLFNSSIMMFLYIFLFCIAFKDDISLFASCNIILQIVCVLLLFHALSAGLVKETAEMTPKGLISDFGFGNSNGCAGYVYSLISNIYFLTFKRMKYLMIFLLLPVTLVVFEYTVSRTFLLASLSLILAHFLCLILPAKLIQKLSVLLAVFPCVMLLISVYYSLNVESYKELDIIMSGRLSLYSNFISSFTPFTFLIGYTRDFDMPLDNFYIALLISGGIILTIVILAFFFIIIMRHSQKLYIYYPFIFSILIYSIGESYLISMLPSNMLLWIFLYKYKFIKV
ncbi:MAG TPA: hypothetical protein DEB74_08710 [Lachnospiraceae bacterium]|nr:hypothetical protein [Lachnospiraceae bacterium]